MRTRRFSRAIIWAVCLSLFGSLILPSVSQAKTDNLTLEGSKITKMAK